MKTSSVIAALLAVLVATATATTFSEWKDLHGKNYHPREEPLRQAIWEKNLAYINEFNAANSNTYSLAMNKFGDLTNEEFQKGYLGVKSDMSNTVLGKPYNAPHASIPDSVDWRTKGYVTPVKDQGQCGSCWSFSATGSLEGQHFRKTGQLVSLSEQNLVDCSTAQGNQGCNGGLMDSAFKYVQIAGIDSEESYPYTARDGTCKFSTANVAANCTGFTDIKKGNESDLTNAIANVGPVSVAIDASHMSFQFYKTGVYDPSLCSSSKLDHGVLAVGYGTLDGKDYYIVKNSWGASWGEKGYILMARNANNKCGISTAASFPLV